MGRFKHLFLFVWFFVCAVILGAMGTNHYMAWNPAHVDVQGSGSWKLTHVLAADCGCSRTVTQSLLKRGPSAAVDEEIIWVGSHDKKSQNLDQLNQLKFKVRAISAADAEKEFTGGVPTLIITNPENKIVYTGGYSSSKIKTTDQIGDLQILAQLQKNEKVESKPIFGCVVGEKFKKLSDPLGLKYSTWW